MNYNFEKKGYEPKDGTKADVVPMPIETTVSQTIAKPLVSRSAYVIQYSSIGKDYEVRIEAANLNRALLEFASYYQNIDAVHSVTKAE